MEAFFMQQFSALIIIRPEAHGQKHNVEKDPKGAKIISGP